MRRIIAVLGSVIAIGFGLVTLLGLLAGDTTSPFAALTSALLQLVVVVVATTVLIGILNLLGVHLGRIFRLQSGWVYSVFLVLSTLLVFGLTLAERANALHPQRGARPYTTILLETVQVSVESALGALVLFALVYGAYRLMRRGATWTGILFTLALLVILIGAIPGVGFLESVRAWLLAVPVSAGARGILLGIALATLVAGIRVLTGQDRSYRE
jgi:hypothetical protein